MQEPKLVCCQLDLSFNSKELMPSLIRSITQYFVLSFCHLKHAVILKILIAIIKLFSPFPIFVFPEKRND